MLPQYITVKPFYGCLSEANTKHTIVTNTQVKYAIFVLFSVTTLLFTTINFV